jgi:hypothetical protein
MDHLDEAERDLQLAADHMTRGEPVNAHDYMVGAVDSIIAHLRASQPATESVHNFVGSQCRYCLRTPGQVTIGEPCPDRKKPEAPPVEGVSDFANPTDAELREMSSAGYFDKGQVDPSMDKATRATFALRTVWNEGNRSGYERGKAEASRSSAAKDARIAELQTLYSELLYQVGSVYPGETRHQTALRYLRKAEQGNVGCGQAPKPEEPTP